jgi:hypothetical protein
VFWTTYFISIWYLTVVWFRCFCNSYLTWGEDNFHTSLDFEAIVFFVFSMVLEFTRISQSLGEF